MYTGTSIDYDRRGTVSSHLLGLLSNKGELVRTCKMIPPALTVLDLRLNDGALSFCRIPPQWVLSAVVHPVYRRWALITSEGPVKHLS